MTFIVVVVVVLVVVVVVVSDQRFMSTDKACVHQVFTISELLLALHVVGMRLV